MMPEQGSGFSLLAAGDLPIYRCARGNFELFYAPGYLAVTPAGQADAFAQKLLHTPVRSRPATELRRHARVAQETRATQANGDFNPVCLTLYLHNECNLQCSYCFAEPTLESGPRLDLQSIQAAARLVMANCQARQQPFTLVCHGGGEPTLHRPQLERTLSALETMAGEHDLPIFRYLATNGVMSPAKAAWIARRFDLIGLSCDGPPDIQDRQRPLVGGQNSSSYVERTARVIREEGTPLHVRVTIPAAAIPRQPEIAAYICQTLRPAEIHVEPVYQAGRAGPDHCLLEEQAHDFVTGFLKARQVARSYGVDWSTSGSRPHEIHGPYCHVFRDVINLVPGGVATACFLTTGKEQTEAAGLDIGRMRGEAFALSAKRIRTLRARLGALPDPCRRCFNQYHCARACPGHCPLDETSELSTFHCRVQQKLTQARLEHIAERLWAGRREDEQIVGESVGLPMRPRA